MFAPLARGFLLDIRQRLYKGSCRRCERSKVERKEIKTQNRLRSEVEGLDNKISELERSIRDSPGFGNAVFGKLEELRWRQERLRIKAEERVSALWEAFERKWGRRDLKNLMYNFAL